MLAPPVDHTAVEKSDFLRNPSTPPTVDDR